jgi:type II secretory pathway pseudopilin PulG
MSTTKKLIKSAQRLIRNVFQLGKTLTKQVMNWLLRNLFVLRRHPNSSQAGFVLPTVIMVMLVVTLLTTAILFRSFDRAKNASNVRVNEATLNAATPALDRARAKIEAVLADPTLPRSTPADSEIRRVIQDPDKYRFGDEIQLKLKDSGSGEERLSAWRFPVDTDNNGKFDSFTVYSVLYETPPGLINNSSERKQRNSLEARSGPMSTGSNNPVCAAAEGTSASLVGSGGWVNAGGILKKSFFVYVANVPITDLDDVRGTISDPDQYEAYQKGNKGFSALELQADVPQVPLSNNAVVYEDDVEIFAGSDFILNGRIFTNSNLFVFEPANNNPEIKFRQVSSPYSCFYEEENSKIVAGGNVGYGYIALKEDQINDRSVETHLFQGKGNEPTYVETLSKTNQSVSGTPAEIGYNNNAYENRIAELIKQAKGKDLPDVVDDAIEEFKADGLLDDEAEEKALDRYFRERTRRVPYAEVGYGEPDPITIDSGSLQGSGDDLRPSDELMYLYQPDGKTLKAEITTDPADAVKLNFNKTKTLYPQATKFETQEQDGVENFIGDRVLVGNNLPELRYENGEWVGDEQPQEIQETEWDKPAGESPRQRKTRVTTLADAGDISRNGFWENAAADQPKDKYDSRGGLRVVTGAGVYLPELNDSETLATHASRIVWPDWMPVIQPLDPATPAPDDRAPASLVPYKNAQAKSIAWIKSEITAGNSSVLDNTKYPTEPPVFFDPSTGGLTPDPTAQPKRHRPFLRMRAAAVYHYINGDEPIACVATYYDPTNWITARNYWSSTINYLDDVSGDTSLTHPVHASRPWGEDGASSVNGITFKYPTGDPDAGVVKYLSEQIYPNGRRVNPWLYKYQQGDKTSPAAKAAYDATKCALAIYGHLSGDTTTLGDSGLPNETPTTDYTIPHGTIRETAFLDARQIKAIDGEDTLIAASDPLAPRKYTDYEPTAEYDLPIEQRYPLEIRATVLDLDELRHASTPQSPHGVDEYLLPNSGIIYATRDDALPDASDEDSCLGSLCSADELTKEDSNPKLAATDFKLDPTRRPNAIMLVKGARLGRGGKREFRDVEKGLIAASNLPVYIKAQPADNTTAEGFNPHQDNSGTLQQEFTKEITADNNTDNRFYTRQESQLNPNFACRKGDPRLEECKIGDDWRPATVLSDGITLLSSSFREGFRNEGDYDLRNNQIDNENDRDGDGVLGDLTRQDEVRQNGYQDIQSGWEIEAKRLWNGFWNNDFAINGLSSNNTNDDLTGTPVFPPETDSFPVDPPDRLDDITPAAFPKGQGLTDDSYSTNNGTDTDPRTDTDPPLLPLNSSYFNNMVTPVQRRLNDPSQGVNAANPGVFPEYAMEYCPKTLVSDCQPTDWIIGLANTTSSPLDTPETAAKATSADIITLNYQDTNPSNDLDVDNLGLIAGTTATPPQGAAIGKPRRVAFLRQPNGNLIFDDNNNPIPLGISIGNLNPPSIHPFPSGTKSIGAAELTTITTINLCQYGATSCTQPNASMVSGNNIPRLQRNALWFATLRGSDLTFPLSNRIFGFQLETPLFYRGIADQQGKIYNKPGDTRVTVDDNSQPLNGQPLLDPVLQLQTTTLLRDKRPDNVASDNAGTVHWIPRPTISTDPEDTTIFNVVMATRDNPSRPPKGTHEGDIGGALSVLPRFLENWLAGPDNPQQSVQIDGSFIQIGRSFYATAPFYQLPNTGRGDNSLFIPKVPYYRMGFAQRKQPAYEAPGRAWGFDVGLLSQIPDLFAQNFAIAPDEEPNLFFREVSRNDPWIQTLLCAKTVDDKDALPGEERPSSCP